MKQNSIIGANGVQQLPALFHHKISIILEHTILHKTRRYLSADIRLFFVIPGDAARGAALEVTRLLGQSHQHFSALIRIGDGQIKWQPVDCLPAQQI